MLLRDPGLLFICLGDGEALGSLVQGSHRLYGLVRNNNLCQLAHLGYSSIKHGQFCRCPLLFDAEFKD